MKHLLINYRNALLKFVLSDIYVWGPGAQAIAVAGNAIS